MRRRLLGFKRRLRAERGESGSESESEDEAAVAARFGMQKVGAGAALLVWLELESWNENQPSVVGHSSMPKERTGFPALQLRGLLRGLCATMRGAYMLWRCWGWFQCTGAACSPGTTAC